MSLCALSHVCRYTRMPAEGTGSTGTGGVVSELLEMHPENRAFYLYESSKCPQPLNPLLRPELMHLYIIAIKTLYRTEKIQSGLNRTAPRLGIPWFECSRSGSGHPPCPGLPLAILGITVPCLLSFQFYHKEISVNSIGLEICVH